MRTLVWNSLNSTQQLEVLQRPRSSASAELQATTRAILRDVAENGDEALKRLTSLYDGIELAALRVPKEKIFQALEQLEPDTLAALQLARDNIERFHRYQKPKRLEVPTQAGIRCYREARAIEKVGLYVPGGSAPLPSTVLMLGIPSQIAGNSRRVLCTPAQKNGEVHPVVLAAAALTEIDEVYPIGGAQAIAAMAYGTETIPKVFKIFGPGNAWVTEAKIQVSADARGAAIDMPAGPSELLVIADNQADPRFVAIDLLSQAEHGPDSQVVLVTNSADFAEKTLAELKALLPRLSRRATAEAALQNGVCLITPDLKTALEISDLYAPEHLILQVFDAEVWARQVQNAGSVFLGGWSPESAGDYASGTNHVLPTYGHARSQSGLSVESFMKTISFQHLSREGLTAIAPAVEKLAALEGLEAHRLAVALRMNRE